MPREISIKLGNWGIHVLHRLKYMFDHAEYCDLTLQFKNNEQVKVHRLIINACTDYFTQLERTCKINDGCLIMPDDLQADVIIPIINFIYTGQLKYPIVQHDKLRAYTVIMDMPVLTHLLDQGKLKAQEIESDSIKAGLQNIEPQDTQLYEMKFPPTESLKVVEPPDETSNKRSYANAFKTTSDDMRDPDENDQNGVNETIDNEANAQPECKKNKVSATEVVQEMDTLSSEWSEEDMSQDANDIDTESEVEESGKEKEKSENKEATPQQLLSQNESQPSVTINPKVLISSLLNDWDDSQEGDQTDKDEPTVINTETHLSIPEVNSENQDNSSTISEDTEAKGPGT